MRNKTQLNALRFAEFCVKEALAFERASFAMRDDGDDEWDACLWLDMGFARETVWARCREESIVAVAFKLLSAIIPLREKNKIFFDEAHLLAEALGIK